jgi:arylsulfatase A-like enzyme
MFTGLYAHDSGLWTNGGSSGDTRSLFGGYARWVELGLDDRSIASHLDAAGYRTAHFGKFLNLFSAEQLSEVPSGWDEFAATAKGREPGMPYYNYVLQGVHDGEYLSEAHGELPEDYSTRVLRDKALDLIERDPAEPLFLHLAFNGPHSRFGGFTPTPSSRDEDAAVALPPLPPNVNEEDVSDKPRFVRKRDPIPRPRLLRWRTEVARTLLSVDRAIGVVLRAQRERDPGLANTIVIFTSDNGYMTGSHRLMKKGVPYEEAIHVPLLVWAPSLPGGTVTRVVSNIDLAATIADAAGVEIDAPDARSFLSEARGRVVIEGYNGGASFCGIRTGSEKFVRYATGEREYYDLAQDPFELENRPQASRADELYAQAVTACFPLPPDWPRPQL